MILDPGERPSKRTRREPSERDAQDQNLPKKRLLFDLLPHNPNENIARCLGAQSNAKNWLWYTSQDDIATVYGLHGDFADCMCSRFNAIYLSLFDDVKDYISVRTVDLAFKILMRGAGNVKAVYVEVDCSEEFKHHELFISISEVCRNIDSFILPGSSALPYLKSFGNRLKKLIVESFKTRKSIMAITLYCTGIRQLSLGFIRPVCLERSRLWESVGDTLEILHAEVASKGLFAQELHLPQAKGNQH